MITFHLLQFFKQAGDAYLILYDAAKVGYVDPLLLHRVTEAKGNGVVLKRVVVYGYAVGSAYRVLTAVTLAD